MDSVCRLVEAVGLPTRLRDVGVTEAMIPELTKHARVDLNWATNPRPVSEEDMEAMYRAAF